MLLGKWAGVNRTRHDGVVVICSLLNQLRWATNNYALYSDYTGNEGIGSLTFITLPAAVC